MQVRLDFGPDFHGSMKNSHGDELKLGRDPGEFKPYELLPTAMGSCFYVTFLGIAEKQKLEFTGASLEISGEHREEVPTTLKEVQLIFSIHGADKEQEKKFQRAAELAGKYCSIYQTIGSVAEMTLEVKLD